MSAPMSSAADWKSLLAECKTSSSTEQRFNGLKELHQRLPVPPQTMDTNFQQPLINVLLQAIHDRPSTDESNAAADSVQSLALRSLSHVFSHPSILTSERFDVLRKKMYDFYIRPSTDAKQLFERFPALAEPIIKSIMSFPVESVTTESDSSASSTAAKEKDEAAAVLRRELRQLKEARKQEEAAEKRRAKAQQTSTSAPAPAPSAVEPGKSSHTVEDGTESAPFGNFHNYYEFNAPQERLQLIPTQMAECIMQIKSSKLQSATASTFAYVDVGCNEGDLTMGLLQHLLSGLRGEKNQPPLNAKGELDSADSSSASTTTTNTTNVSTHAFTAATSSHHPHSGTQIHAIGVDIDPVLIERAQRKVEPFRLQLNTSHALDSNQMITPQPTLQFHSVDIMQPGSVDRLLQMLSTAAAAVPSSSSSSSSSSSKPFDLICCYSITMWIHLHGGDAGLQYFLRTLASLTENLLIEPQPWSCYRNARERWRRSGKEDPAQMATLKWRTEVESEIRTFVEKECHMQLKLELGSTKWKRKVWWFERK